jgi:hypothetical protein
MKDFAEEHSDSLAAQMTLLQCHLNNANFHAMESLLQKLLEREVFAEFEPGFVSLLVWLYERNGKHIEACDLLETRCVATSRNERQQLAEFKLNLSRYSEALLDYEWLVEHDKTDSKAIAGYVLCLSQTEPYKAFEMLPSLKARIVFESVNVEELEQLPGKTSQDVVESVKRKKKRTKPLPKNYNPDMLPNPGI